MGYACPVCETPQRDGEHLANHLAFTAMLGDDAHEEWLAEHAPNWEEAGPGELAERVLDHAEPTEYDEVFEDTVDRSGPPRHDHDHTGAEIGDSDSRHPEQPPMDPEAARRQTDGPLDADAKEVLQEAQELTRQLLEEEAAADEDGDAGGDEGKDS